MGVGRQLDDCAKLCADRGWDVVGAYEDNDRSAYSGARRPAYERLLSDVEEGRVTVVVAWDQDRLFRSMKELERFIDLVEKVGARAETVNGGEHDLKTSDGRLQARIKGSVARHESEKKAERLRRKHQELADRGLWKGGPRPYGYRPVPGARLEVDQAEAAVVRECAKRVLAGESIPAICKDLNARGVPTAQGAGWRPQTLKRVLTAWTIAGHRERRGEDGGPGVWEPILEARDHQRLRAVVLDPSRTRPRPARTALLAGIATCGVCGTRLISQRRQSRKAVNDAGDVVRVRGRRVMVCSSTAAWQGCGGISVQAEPLEAVVAEALLQRLDSPALATAIDEAVSDAASERLAVQARMEELAAAFGGGEITMTEWKAARGPLDSALRDLDHQAGLEARSAALAPYSGQSGALRAAWPSMTLDQQRAVVSAVIERVVVNRTERRGRAFDAARLDVIWVDDLGR